MKKLIDIRFRRDHSATWIKVNPILDSGEPGYERNTGRLKIGDGESRWTELEYINAGGTIPDVDSAIQVAIQEHINSTAPHPVYDDGPSLLLLYQNVKV